MDGAIGTIVVHDIWSQVIILISLGIFPRTIENLTTHYNLQEEKAAHSVAWWEKKTNKDLDEFTTRPNSVTMIYVFIEVVPPEIAWSIFVIGGMSNCNRPSRIWTTCPIVGLSQYHSIRLVVLDTPTTQQATRQALSASSKFTLFCMWWSTKHCIFPSSSLVITCTGKVVLVSLLYSSRTFLLPNMISNVPFHNYKHLLWMR